MTLFLCSVLPLWSGGTRRWGGPAFSKTVEAYCDRGHHVVLVTSAPETARYARPNLYVHVVPGRLSSLPNRFVFNLLRYLLVFPAAALVTYWRVSRTSQIDAIYGYEVEGVLAASVVRFVSRKPLVTRFQGTILAPIVLAAHRRLRPLVGSALHILAFKVRADLAIMTDDGTRGLDVMRRLNPDLAKRTRFWRNGVDPSQDSSTADHPDLPWLDDATSLRLLTVSRLVGWKRVDRAIRAMPMVVRHVDRVVLAIVGDGPEMPALKALATALGVLDAVRFVGHVPHAHVGRYYQHADIFLSLYDLSNVGNPLLEAMRSGRAVVALATGDTRTVVTDGVTGVLLERGEPEDVSQAIIRLADDPALRSRLGEGARCFAEASFWTWPDRMAAELDVVLGMRTARHEC
jgi:glycosyltransferase involved in cell wall biosynthesis